MKITPARSIFWGWLIILLSASALHAARDGRIVFDAAKIQSGPARTIYDLLNQVPGIKATSTSISIRGSLKVLVMMDGRSINDPTSTTGGVRWDVVDLSQVHKIIILLGKGGVEYGDNASGGVVDISTRKIKQMQGHVEVKGGNRDTRDVNAAVRNTFGNIGLGVNAGFYDTRGFRINGDKRKRRIETRMNNSGSAFKINASAFYCDENKGNPGLPDYPTPLSRGKKQMASGVLNMGWQKIKSKTAVNWGNKKTKDPEKNLDTYLEVLRIQQEVFAPVDLGFAGCLSLGAGYELAEADAAGFSRKTEEKAFAFLAKSVSFSTIPVSVHTGLRGIYYSEYDNGLSPEISLQIKKNRFSGKVSASRTFDAPPFTKKYRRTSTTIPNPDLTIEKATNFSATLAWEPGPQFSLSLSPFYNIIDDRISYVRTNGIGQYRNFGEVTYTGADAGVHIRPWQWLSLKSSYVYLEAKDQETKRWLSAKPRHRWVNTLDCKPVEGLSIGLTAAAVSWVYGNSTNTERHPGYLLWDVKAEYIYKRLTFMLEIENLFDTEYFYADGYPAEPLTWTAGVKWRF